MAVSSVQPQAVAAGFKREKLEYTKEIIDKIIKQDPKSAFDLANEGLAMARELSDDLQGAWFLWRMGKCCQWLSRFDDAENFLNQAARLYQRHHDLHAYHRMLGALAEVKNTACDYRTALDLARRAIEFYRENDIRSIDYLVVLISACLANCSMGEYTAALEYAYEGIKVLDTEEITDEMQRPTLYLNIGNIHYYMGDYERAHEYYLRTHDEYKRLNKLIGQGIILLNIARIYWRAKGDYERALQYQLDALEIFIKLGTQVEQIKVSLDIAIVYAKMNQFDRALEYLNKAETLGKSVLDKESFLIPCIYMRKADVYSLMGDDTATLNNLKQALQYSEPHNNPTLASSIHELLSAYYEKQRDFHKAFEHYKEYLQQNDVVRGSRRQRTIDEIETRAERERLAREKELLKSRLVTLETEKERKTKEAELKTLQLWQKNEVLSKMKKYIESIQRLSDVDKMKLVADVRRYIQAGMDIDNKWEHLEQVLGNLQSEFLERLTLGFPEITGMELKICALMKMHLDTKEIAGLLFISPQTVYTHRKRIRRKLNLNSDTKLVHFLDTF